MSRNIRKAVSSLFQTGDRVAWTILEKRYHGEVIHIKDRGLRAGINVMVFPPNRGTWFFPRKHLYTVTLVHREKD